MNFNKVLKEYFQNNKTDANVSVIREDGIVLYSDFNKTFKSESVGALAAGVWQAAHALSASLEKTQEILDFRLSFDKSDEGVYILGIKHNDSNYLLCSIYKNISNPAKLKMSIRKLKNELEKYIKNYKVSSNSDEFLFSEITDDDMDRLFAGGAV